MSIKKYSSGSWVTVPYRKYETATDTITSLPKTIIGDGQPISSWSMDGNMQVNGTPTPQNPITPAETGDKTANLLNPNTIEDNKNIAVGTGLPTDLNGRFATTTPIDVSSINSVSFTYTTSLQQIRFIYSILDSNNTLISRVAGNNSGTTIDTSNADLLYLCVYSDSGALINKSDVTNLMLSAGSTALPYEPYGYKIPILSNGVSYPIYLSEPIRKIGDSVDTVPSTGTATRTIYKKVLTGDEGWQEYSGFYYITLSPTGDTTVFPISSHYTTFRIALSGAQLRIINLTESLSDFVAFLQQQYAAGTPVTVWYVLATATSESFTAPSIPTSGTSETFDVDTTLKPSEVSLTWHGWHEHSDTKYTTP